jgi:hypothetical protein
MYTVEVYKRDRRAKKGERLVRKTDHSTQDRGLLEHLYKTTYFPSEGYRFEIHPTMVVGSSIHGQEFTERYDTPHFCSPSSESYWSM